MIWKEEIINLSSINIEDHTFRITTEENIECLSCSIKTADLINPPIVIKIKSGYTIISGFRRIRSVQNLGWTHFSARVLEPETGGLECAQLAIADNSIQRSLNLIETSRCYKLLSEFFEGDDLFREASLIGLSGNPALVKKIKLLSYLPPYIQNCLISETVSLSMALELDGLEPGAGIAFARLFDKLKPSLNKQREILTLSCEIAARENIPVANLMNEDDFRNIFTDENTDRNQKIRQIRDYLKMRRFPSIMKAEKSFEKNVQKLGLMAGMKIVPPAGFEGNTFIINLEFKKTEELTEKAKFLEKLTENPAFKDILSKQFHD